MSGRKQFDVEEALDKAMQVFWQHGYAETSLDLLGKATGLGRGSLYGTFGSKDALFRKSLERYASTFGAKYEQALGLYPGDPVGAVEAFFDVVLDRIADPALPEGCLIAQSASQAPTLDAASQAQVRDLLAMQHKRVRAALSASETDEPEMDDIARFVVAVNQSLAVLSRAGATTLELRSIVRVACDAVTDALARFDASARPGTDRRSPTGKPGRSRGDVK